MCSIAARGNFTPCAPSWHTFIDVEERKAHPAAFWSAMIILVTAFTVTNYVENKIYIVAAFIGAYLGTFGTVRWKQKKEIYPSSDQEQ
nr:hypothetical protein [Nitrosomonas nitrosa]